MSAIDRLQKAAASMSFAEPSEATGGYQILIVRFCQSLIPQNIIAEIDDELSAATPTTMPLIDSVPPGGLGCASISILPSMLPNS
ncbi:MAG: hypothetical protein M1822_002013 [Bathelium mastoideum]|nr:MAG: hypothetical protein M1822_002013 [Bathelium mastoideum]